jgi:hypothetical protein
MRMAGVSRAPGDLSRRLAALAEALARASDAEADGEYDLLWASFERAFDEVMAAQREAQRVEALVAEVADLAASAMALMAPKAARADDWPGGE